MNKRAETTETDDLLKDNTVYLILATIVFSILLYFVLNTSGAATVWSEYYAKEWTKAINSARPGDVITMDIHKATEIAQKNRISSFSEITTFDNANNRVCVKLSQGRRSCYSYFNNVDVVNPELTLGTPINTLTITISEKQNNEQ